MTALLIVDLQRDFLPGGPLAVPDGDAVVPVINRIQAAYEVIAVTQDWHPPDHLSFASQHPGRKPLETIDLDGIEQVLWPDHCTWSSAGAQLADGLDCSRVAAVFRKGMNRRVDSYSAFFDNGRRRKTGLAEWLRALGIRDVHVAGLAAEYCVAFTARDAAGLGFGATILEDATRALSLKAFAETGRALQGHGVRIESTGSSPHVDVGFPG